MLSDCLFLFLRGHVITVDHHIAIAARLSPFSQLPQTRADGFNKLSTWTLSREMEWNIPGCRERTGILAFPGLAQGLAPGNAG